MDTLRIVAARRRLSTGRAAFAAAIALALGAAQAQTTVTVPQDQRVRTTKYTYNDQGSIVTETQEPTGDRTVRLTTTNHYEPTHGNRDSMTVSGWNGRDDADESRQSQAGWDVNGRFTTSLTDPLNHAQAMTLDARFGLPVTHKDPNQVGTRWEYDGFGRKKKESRGFVGDGAAFTDYTTWDYFRCDDAAGGGCAAVQGVAPALKVVEKTFSSAGAKIAATTTTYQDTLGREIRVETERMIAGGTVKAVYHDTVYNARGFVARTSAPYFAGDTPQWTTFDAYDDLGRVTSQTAPNGVVTTTRYTALSSTVTVAAAEGARTRTNDVDVLGLATRTVDANGNSLFSIHDALGNLIQTIDAYGTSVRQTFDVRDRRLSLNDPDLGAWTYTVDAFGETVAQVDAKRQSTSFAYDKLGRLTRRVEPDLTATFEFDTAANGVGLPARSYTDQGYCKTSAYDALARPSGTTANYGGTNPCAAPTDASFTASTSYDAAGRVDTLTYPTGLAVRNVYNATLGFLESVQNFTGGSAGTKFWTWKDGDAEGRVLTYDYGNGLTTVRTFDPKMGWPTDIITGAGVIQYSHYDYDSVGDLQMRQDRFDLPNMVEKTQHDLLGRLTSYALYDSTGTTEVAGSRVSVAYDAVGDIKSKSDVGTYYYNAPDAGSTLPHAVAEVRGALNASYKYADANGNLTTGANRTWAYTSSNLVSAVGDDRTCHQFLYQGDRLRVQETIHPYACQYANGSNWTDRTLYMHPDAANGLQFERDTRGGANTYRHYINAGGVVVGEVLSTSASVGAATPVTVTYFHYDHLGSIVAVTSGGADHSVIERRSFDAWGRPRQTSGAPGTGELPNGLNEATDRGFTLAEHLEGLGIIHMNGRIYDPALGRFASPDPNIPNPDDLQSYNRFSYVENRPLDSTDPTGFFDTPNDSSQQGQNITIGLSLNSDGSGSFGFVGGSSVSIGSIAAGGAGRMSGYVGGSYTTANYALPVGMYSYQQQGAGGVGDSGDSMSGPGLFHEVVEFGKGMIPIYGSGKQFYDSVSDYGFFSWNTGLSALMFAAELRSAGTATAADAPFKGFLRSMLMRGEREEAERLGIGPIAKQACGCCFAAGTPVLTADGLQPIEDVAVGDEVWSRDEHTGQTALKHVTELIHHDGREMYALVILSSGGKTARIEVSDNHPFWVKGRGWVDSRNLKRGMMLQAFDKQLATVVSLQDLGRAALTYNFTVEGLHTFFAGEVPVLVHNADGNCCRAAATALARTLAEVARKKAGFAAEGRAIILDVNLEARGMADALRAQGYNVRTVHEIFGQGKIADEKILELAKTIDARVLTRDVGRQLDGGFFQRAINVDSRVRTPEGVGRILQEGLK